MMENHFKGFTVEHIDRNKNAKADELPKVVALEKHCCPQIFFSDNQRCISRNSGARAEANQCNIGGKIGVHH
jgi:hypothetical protein